MRDKKITPGVVALASSIRGVFHAFLSQQPVDDFIIDLPAVHKLSEIVKLVVESQRRRAGVVSRLAGSRCCT